MKRVFEEARDTDTGCCGWAFPDQCPHDGKFDKDSLACQECEEEAMEAMRDETKVNAPKN
jgi:hypothetical protein